METKLLDGEVEFLLSDLCVRLGLCLPGNIIRRLIKSPHTNADKFADVVYTAEGLDPTLKSDLYKAVLARVKKTFDEHKANYNV